MRLVLKWLYLIHMQTATFLTVLITFRRFAKVDRWDNPEIV